MIRASGAGLDIPRLLQNWAPVSRGDAVRRPQGSKCRAGITAYIWDLRLLVAPGGEERRRQAEGQQGTAGFPLTKGTATQQTHGAPGDSSDRTRTQSPNVTHFQPFEVMEAVFTFRSALQQCGAVMFRQCDST